MFGFLSNGLPKIGTYNGKEASVADTDYGAGAQPTQVKITLAEAAAILTTMMNTLSKTMVAGTIYYRQIDIGAEYTPTPQGDAISEQSFVFTGVNIPLGTPGGTDTWHVGLWNSDGVLVGRSATAGVTAGTALTTQQIPFAGSDGAQTGNDALISVTSGTYYIGIQSNGTTAKFLAINSPIWPLATGSQTGVAGTLPAISAIATTYTANLGPMATLY